MTSPTPYVLGHSDTELKRLTEQGRFYGELTEEIFRRAGLASGMRVLDIGCGAGDVSFIAASIVGSSGSVVGIDASEAAVAAATARAAQAQLRNVRFEKADAASFVGGPFDAVVGRLVLLYLADPASVVRHLAAQLRPSGIVAFVELELSSVRSVPHLPLFSTCVDWLRQTFTASGAAIDMGTRLHKVFRDAGLAAPTMRLLGRVEAGSDSEVYENLAQTVRSLLPAMERFGVARADSVDIETLSARLRAEVLANDAVVIPPCAIGAWTRVNPNGCASTR